MTPDIIRDLTAKRGMDVFRLLTEFNRNASWAGYFYEGADATMLAQIGKYEKTPRHGLHINAWHTNYGKLNPSDFLRLVTEEQKHDAKILGYADDGKNQAISVTKPPIFMTPATPHITVSWINTGNPAASGYMQFNEPIPAGLPSMMHSGGIKVIMHNNREMDLSVFRGAIKALEQERMTEIAGKLDPQIKSEIDKHYDTMSWEELRALIVDGVSFNEELAKLYAQYRADITDDNMPTLSDVMAERLLTDAEADRASDEEYEKTDKDD